VINIVAPAAPDKNCWLLVNGGITAILNFTKEKGMRPQEVFLTYNQNVRKLDIAEKNLMIKIELDHQKTCDEQFQQTQQSLLPVDIRLMPSLNNTIGAKSVSIVERVGGTAVMEGPYGFNATYDIHLRPCLNQLFNDIKVTMTMSVESQLILNATVLTGSQSNQQCKATVNIAENDDSLEEGDQYVNIQQFVSSRTDGKAILLADNSTLLAANFLVQVYDDNIGGVIVLKSNGITALMEMNKTDNNYDAVPSHFYNDEYYVRLTQKPVGSVEIDITSIAVASDYDSTFARKANRSLTKQLQVYVNGSEGAKLLFTGANWSKEVLVAVNAIDDNVEEGVDLLNFASQPSNLVRPIKMNWLFSKLLYHLPLTQIFSSLSHSIFLTN
jgi:hypothetical protein